MVQQSARGRSDGRAVPAEDDLVPWCMVMATHDEEIRPTITCRGEQQFGRADGIDRLDAMSHADNSMSREITGQVPIV
jgi:hypothetical protein